MFCRSPNGVGLVHWQQYSSDEHYLSIGLEQKSAQHLKKNRYTLLTQTVPEKIHQSQENVEHSEL